ncbi:MAG TPA: DUF1684 domain-containing protein [Vicinamibacteria bacterium]|nr:DUF1684 domain-containing protein [Vicinamibacteria bacterium]
MRVTLPILLILAATVVPALADEAYRSEIRKWREQREARLKADDGWLTVAGLFWLHEGANRFGCDSTNEIVLPPGSGPARAGAVDLEGRQLTLRLEPGVPGRLGGRAVSGPVSLRPDSAGPPDELEMGRLTLYVIERGGRFAVRLRDRQSQARREFTHLSWFEVSESYRIVGRFVPHPKLKPITVPNVLGSMETMPSPGYVEFVVDQQTVRLDGVLEEMDAKQLFFIFRDQTSGQETYPSGRFLYADLPRDGKVTLDFNQAYNPPCAFTAYATCPLPPRQNILPVRIPAGEKTYGKGH